MRKQIDISEEILKKLQHLAIEEGTNPKNWIENLIAKEVTKKSTE